MAAMWGAVAAVGSSLLSGAMGSSSAKKAAASQETAAKKAIGAQQVSEVRARQQLEPWTGTGRNALFRLGDLLGIQGAGGPKPTIEQARDEALARHNQQFGEGYGQGSDMGLAEAEAQRIYAQKLSEWEASGGDQPASADHGDLTRKFTMQDFMEDPVVKAGFDYGMSEGTKAIERRSPLVGGYDSGATLKALTRFGTDYTNTKGAESYGRFTNDQNSIYNKLAGVAGLGQNAATNTANMGFQGGQNTANTMLSLGNVGAEKEIAQGNAWSGAANSISNWWQGQQLIDAMKKKSQNPGGNTTIGDWWGSLA